MGNIGTKNYVQIVLGATAADKNIRILRGVLSQECAYIMYQIATTTTFIY